MNKYTLFAFVTGPILALIVGILCFNAEAKAFEAKSFLKKNFNLEWTPKIYYKKSEILRWGNKYQ